ncbi:WYL domain-containing protein [Alteromonas sp. W364]|uniref:WYL domain-containing protein n=1 Tax=Alteromonas sp. W364 TaxID=3075610 RepID=UPI0028867128|nr:WYL domain-containing protein [Alteromonas sp. W364]MDT0628062.1 WYL domain-containing protein [Alteromonas sp. W364]
MINSQPVMNAIDEFYPELRNKTSTEQMHPNTNIENDIDRDKYQSFKRNIHRKLIAMVSESKIGGEERLIKSVKNKRNIYYWASEEAKNEAIGLEKISDKRFEARMLIFRFIDAYFHSFIPPDVLACLKEDLQEAQFDYHTWEDKLRFLPQGLNTTIKHLEHSLNNTSQQSDQNIDDNLLRVFNALDKNVVFSATYNSLHKNIFGTEVELSPQRIEYLNQKVLLLAYVHANKKYKRFEISRLKDVKHLPKKNFKKIDWNEYEQNYDFDFRTHDWVVNSLKASGFGHDTSVSSHGTGMSRIKGQIALPNHFNHDGPDIFDCVNFLSHYGDALEVLKPDFLRDEMKRRATNAAQLYSTRELTDRKAMIIQSSAAEQANDIETLTVTKKRYEDNND